MDAQAQRGRWLLAAIIAVTFIGDGSVVLAKIAAVGLDNCGGSVVRLALTGALFAAIWQGLTWARWLMVFLLSIGLVMVVKMMLLGTVHPIGIAVGVQFLVSIVPLAFSPSISAFLAFQSEALRAHYRDPFGDQPITQMSKQ